MFAIFYAASSFNQDISGWDVSNVTSMSGVFNGSSSFNINISQWDTSKATSMSAMFASTAFNQDIGNWDVSSVTDMRFMFRNATAFNQDLSGWCVQSNFGSAPSGFNDGTANNTWVNNANSQPDWGGADGSAANCN